MNSEIYNKAQEILQNRRQNAVIENERRIAEINERLPQIMEINNKISNSGRQLIKICMSAGKNAQNSEYVKQEIEKLKRDNLEAQQVSRWHLEHNGYPADYLDIHYTCPVCNDTGYKSDSTICECFQKICGQLASEEINSHSSLKLSSFDSFNFSYYSEEDCLKMKRIFNFLKNYAENFTMNSKNIFMFGKTGLGKTHLSLAVANKVLEQGYSVIYDSIINILREMEKEHFQYNYHSEMVDHIMQTDLLIIDDLGTENTTTFYISTIYNIINTRINKKLPTIISSNLDFDRLKFRYDERIVSRIATLYENIKFFGTDMRYKLNIHHGQIITDNG